MMDFAVPDHVVGIGASAGGLVAIEQFFSKMPVDTGLAFVVVQHLSPDFESLLDELLKRHTKMNVCKVADGEPLRANTIYVNQPRQWVEILDGKLSTRDSKQSQASYLPINAFMKSLSKVYRQKAIGIILSGTGTDGAEGVKEIRNRGGVVLVQDAETSEFDGMPKAALATGAIDFELSPSSMPTALLQHLRLTQYEGEDPGGDLIPDDALAVVYSLLRGKYDFDFTYYKLSTIRRRIHRRLNFSRLASIDEYVLHLRDNEGELHDLYNDLLIGVTHFFRDQEAFDQLKSSVIPSLVEAAPDDEPLRIWIPGCATGEEAYSLAMLMRETVNQSGRPRDVKVFATDVHQTSLEHAGQGIYSENQIEGIPREYVKRYFSLSSRGYQISPQLRQMVIFAQHNVVKDPPFTRLNLISCRNLLIYLQPVAQRRVLSMLHFALKTGGILFLGSSETLGDLSDEFETIHQRCRIYRKRRDAPVGDRKLMLGMNRAISLGDTRVRRSGAEDSLMHRVYAEVVEKTTPPGFLVNERRELVHVFGDARKYLSIPSGQVTMDLTRMANEDLQLAITASIHRARSEGERVVFTNINAEVEDKHIDLEVTVTPVEEPRSAMTFFLISLQETGVSEASEKSTPFDPSSESNRRVDELERELQYSREHLRSTVEELETSNEELQSTNEELVAANEELQSTNEELHSVNEELYSVNSEHQRKIVELTQLTSDMDNLLRSTEIGSVFVDNELKIRKYTPAIRESIFLEPQDIGRPIEHIAHDVDLGGDDFLNLVQQVVGSHNRVERETTNRSGKPLLMRIVPYHAKADDTASGAVISFIDISEVTEFKQRLRESRETLATALTAAEIGIWEWDVDADVFTLDERLFRIFGMQVTETSKRYNDIVQVIHADDVGLFRRAIANAVQLGEPLDVNFRVVWPDDSIKWLHAKASVSRTAPTNTPKLKGICWDETARFETALENERLASMIDLTEDAVIGVTTSLTVNSWNRGAERLYGYSREQILGEPINRLANEQSYPTFEAMIRSALDGMTIGNCRCVHQDANGHVIHVSGSACPVVSKTGTPIGASAILRDIGNAVAAEQKIAATNEKLKRANAELEQFSFVASHDLREPLRTIRSFCELLEGKCSSSDDEQTVRWLQFVTDAASRMQELIDALMNYARLNLDSAPTEITSMREVVEDAANNLKAQVDEKGVHIEISELPDLAVDRVLMTQLFQNLLSNAIKFSGSADSRSGQPPTVQVNAKRGADEWTIQVADNGIGIEQKFTDKVFDLFRRLHGREDYPGTGIGLTICQKIIRLHGGKIWVEANQPRGTVVSISVPCTAMSTA